MFLILGILLGGYFSLNFLISLMCSGVVPQQPHKCSQFPLENRVLTLRRSNLAIDHIHRTHLVSPHLDGHKRRNRSDLISLSREFLNLSTKSAVEITASGLACRSEFNIAIEV